MLDIRKTWRNQYTLLFSTLLHQGKIAGTTLTLWCQYQKDKATSKQTYKPAAGFPLDIVAKLKPIYDDLNKYDLLENCLQGKTQNQNESFNATILKLGVYDAIANFNIGKMSVILVLENMKIVPGYYTLLGCKKENKPRLFIAGYRNKPSTQKCLKIIRGMIKSKEDQDWSWSNSVWTWGVLSII